MFSQKNILNIIFFNSKIKNDFVYPAYILNIELSTPKVNTSWVGKGMNKILNTTIYGNFSKNIKLGEF